MRKFLFCSLLILFLSLSAMAQGVIPLNEVVYFDIATFNITTGGLLAADSAPTFEVLEESTDTAILTPTCTLRTSHTSTYRCTFTASAANGFELGKWYIVNAYATVSGTASEQPMAMHFRLMAAESTAGVVEADVSAINNVSTSTVTTVKPIQGLTTADTITSYAGNTPQTGDAFARLGAPAGASVSADIAYVKNLNQIRSQTAQAGSGTTITLDTGAVATNSFYNNDLLLILSGTGAGQARFITAYVGATKIATVATWAINPDNTSVYVIEPFDAVAGATAPTVAQIKTGIWQDLTSSSDFSTASSIGLLLATQIDAAISSRMGAYAQPAGFLAVTFPSGTLASPTNITAGTMTNLTNAPTNGDFTAAMKTSLSATIGDVTIKKNVAFPNYPIWMLTSAGTAVTGLTNSQILCQYQLDNGSFANLAAESGTGEVEVGLGKYRIDLAQAETNGNVLSIVCTGTGAQTYRTNVTPQH